METPKYEIVQQVKWVLVRHGVDLSRLQFSCTKSSLFLSGALKKEIADKLFKTWLRRAIAARKCSSLARNTGSR